MHPIAAFYVATALRDQRRPEPLRPRRNRTRSALRRGRLARPEEPGAGDDRARGALVTTGPGTIDQARLAHEDGPAFMLGARK